MRWVYTCPKPVFSSPALLPSGEVAVGCVSGRVYLIGRDGELVGNEITVLHTVVGRPFPQ